MSANKIDDNICREEAGKSSQDETPVSEGTVELSLHEDNVKIEGNGGKTAITSSEQSLESIPTNIGDAGAINKDNVVQTQGLLDLKVSNMENIDKAAGDSKISLENAFIEGEEVTTTDSIEHLANIVVNDEIVALNTSKQELKTTDVIVITDHVSNNADVNNGIVTDNIIQPSETTDSNTVATMSQVIDNCSETDDMDNKIDCNDEDDMQLKWDEDDSSDRMECDDSNEENVGQSTEETGMDVDKGSNDVLDDIPIINNDATDANTNISNIIQSTEKKTDQNYENTEVPETNTEAALLENKATESLIESHEAMSPVHDDMASHNISIENSSDLIMKDHGINKPDVMLEIPTQELIDLDDSILSPGMDSQIDDKELIGIDNCNDDNETEIVNDELRDVTDDASLQEHDIDKNLDVNTANKALHTVPSQPSTSSITNIKTVLPSEIPEITGHLGTLGLLNICPEVCDGPDKSVSSSVVPKVSEDLEIAEDNMEQELELSSTTAVTLNMAEETSDKLLNKIKPAVTASNELQLTDNLDTLVSSSMKTMDATDKVADKSDNDSVTEDIAAVTDKLDTHLSDKNIPDTTTNLIATTANELTEMTDNLDNVVQSDNVTSKSLSKVSELNTDTPDATVEVTERSDNIKRQALPTSYIHTDTDSMVKPGPADNIPPVTTDKVPELSDKMNLEVTTSKASPNINDNTVNSGLADDKIPELSDSMNSEVTTTKASPNITDNVNSGPSDIINTDIVLKSSDTTDQLATTSKMSSLPSDNLGMSENMVPDTSDEMPEVSDSLGLLAESSRVMEDDDYQEDDEEADADDDDEFDQDESSNQMTTAEHSEDSNTQQSETDANRDEKEMEISPPVESEGEFQFMISNVESQVADTSEMESNVEPTGDVLPATQEPDEKSEEAENIDKPEKTVSDVKADIQTVGLSDNEADAATTPQKSEQTSNTTKDNSAPPTEFNKQSPGKTRKLEMSTSSQPVFNIVDLEESSSEDDIQEVNQAPATESKPEVAEEDGVTNVNLPDDIEVMCTSAGSTSEIVTKEGEVVISGVPKPPPVKLARLNTSEVSIKKASTASEQTLVIPEAKAADNEKTSKSAREKPKLCLEIFSLDSDDDTRSAEPGPAAPPRAAHAPDTALSRPCTDDVLRTKRNLINGIKDFCPLLELGRNDLPQDLVEISDSESEDGSDEVKPPADVIGEKGAKLLEENLAAILNETWRKYKLDERLKETHAILDAEIQKLENESKEIDDMLNECQIATDKLRNELYSTFERPTSELPTYTIYDTPIYNYTGPEVESADTPAQKEQPVRQSKRRLSTQVEVPAKKPAIPLGYSPLDVASAQNNVQESKTTTAVVENNIDDDTEVSVVRLSAEAAPAGLPAPGALGRPPLKPGMAVYAMRNAFGPWLRCKILEVQPKLATSSSFTVCRVKFEHKVKNPCKILSARCLAYPESPDVRMVIGTRIIALFKDPTNVKREKFYSGVVAEAPNPVNSYRYLVFFDDGYAQYVQHADTRLVCESSTLVWEEVHPFSRQFVKDYLMSFPERPMVKLHKGQNLKTELNGKWWSSRVVCADASLAQVMFVGSGRREWIYRGSTRLSPLYLELQAATRRRQRPVPRTKAQPGRDMPYVEYTRSDEQETNKQEEIPAEPQQNDEMRRQRAVAKKSTAIPVAAAPAQPPASNLDTVTSRVVYYTPKAAIKPHKMVPHHCGPRCKRRDVLSLRELRTYNPLAKPLLSGWERQIVRFKGHKEVMYRAPCGRRLRSLAELHRYLRDTLSELPVDLFDFHHATHCLAEFVLNKCLVGKKDLSHGKENVPVPCVNYYDESLPEFCSYNTERTPTAGVPLNLDPEFLCGCDCTDDCMDKSKCACWRMTLEGARTIGLEGPNVGYVYKRLPEPLPSGIYECNSRCKCKATCLNRVAQHPLQLKLQVFKTLNRGWGIRALNDIPKGAFLCVYAGNLLTDATANLDGLNEGDEYLAELDYIEVVEQMKEGYEEDVRGASNKDKKERGRHGQAEDSSEEELPSSEEEEEGKRGESEDRDFQPKCPALGLTEFNKALRKRDKTKKDAEEKEKENTRDEEDCITISDDDEVREPSRFTAQAGMAANEFISKYRSVRSHFGKDEACYIMDAKVQGNIGRYLNHSCTPNVFVQNVFVDTHDPRFPWVAFFALSHIKAGSELTWNYNYDVGSVPGKVLYCFCGAVNCRGRLL